VQHQNKVLVKTIWLVVNVSLVALSVRQGYASLAPEQLRHVNPDAVFCSAILLTLPLFALFTVLLFVRRCNVDKLRRPSFDRNPLNWWYDPLQSLSFPRATVQRWQSAVYCTDRTAPLHSGWQPHTSVLLSGW